jgi:hypothetical protein
VDGIGYFDLSDFKSMVPELRQLKTDWLGFDMIGLIELSMEEAAASAARSHRLFSSRPFGESPSLIA